MNKAITTTILSALVCMFTSAVPAEEFSADLAVINANVITVDDANTRAEAFAVKNDKFIAVGATSHIQKLLGRNTTVVNAQGKTVTPGFIDAHLHPRAVYPVNSRLAKVDLSPASVKTIDELISALRKKAQATPKGQWVFGGRYQDTKLGRHPTRWDLDKASTEHPISIVHSSGDREIDMVLDAIEKALQKLPRRDHRHRIEHCSVVNRKILQRVKKLGVVLALHSYIYEHGDKMEDYSRKRWPMMHANRSAIEMGIVVAGNSDSPVSAAHPLLRIQSMVTRKTVGSKVYGPEQRVCAEDAIRVWMMGSAYASFEEDIKGSIEVGKLADSRINSEIEDARLVK